MDKQSQSSDWIDKAKKRGYGQVTYLLLDVIEPIAPLVAQGLWVVQPLAGLWGAGNALQILAETLESPDGVKQLQHRLSDDTQE
jgi:hypothetical protein